MLAGTPMYMAPEQAKGETLDHRADLFSLGSVLYVMATGRPPFRAATTFAVLKRVVDDDPRPIREVIPETPQWLCDIIAKLHAKKPEERFQSAREVADVLADCEAQLKAHAKLKDFRRIPRSQPRRSGRWKWAAVAATVLLLPVFVLAVTEFAGVTHLYRGEQAAQPQRPPSPEPIISVGGGGSADGGYFTSPTHTRRKTPTGRPGLGAFSVRLCRRAGPLRCCTWCCTSTAPEPSFVVGSRGMHWTGSGGPVEIIDGPMNYGDAARLEHPTGRRPEHRQTHLEGMHPKRTEDRDVPRATVPGRSNGQSGEVAANQRRASTGLADDANHPRDYPPSGRRRRASCAKEVQRGG